jgi:potassium/hydrogen antiporter
MGEVGAQRRVEVTHPLAVGGIRRGRERTVQGDHELIFFGAVLALLGIFAGMASSRFGAPLLLVFLGLGMLAGPEGLGGVAFSDFHLTYLVGSLALAIILFDGGLRTSRDAFRLAMAPSLLLATAGVLVTALMVAGLLHWVMNFKLLEALLVGSIVASTDAAAVFFLLNTRGMEIQHRVRATLEIESGFNDPMAVFLTITCVELLGSGVRVDGWEVLGAFALQLAGGVAIGLGGGYVLVALINRIEVAAGLYPILAVAGALAIFGGAQSIHASGFLAVYLAGFVVGNRRHRAAQLINRFHDGMAWLSQIVMFLTLGLLIVPSQLVGDLVPSMAVALFLIVAARPLAVALCLAPFRFKPNEIAFVAWVGLRGAVPFFLATIPIVAGIPGGMTYFAIATITVLASLAIQGWTIGPAASVLKLQLPPAPEALERLDVDMLHGLDRDIAGYRVSPGSPAVAHGYGALPLPRRARIITVIRDGTVMDRTQLARLEPDDVVLAVAPPEQLLALDRLFASPPPSASRGEDDIFGEFILDAKAPVGEVGRFYGFSIASEEQALSVAEFVAARLKQHVVAGDRVQVGALELVVREARHGQARRVGLEIDPKGRLNQVKAVGRWLRRRVRRLVDVS